MISGVSRHKSISIRMVKRRLVVDGVVDALGSGLAPGILAGSAVRLVGVGARRVHTGLCKDCHCGQG